MRRDCWLLLLVKRTRQPGSGECAVQIDHELDTQLIKAMLDIHKSVARNWASWEQVSAASGRKGCLP